MICPVSAYKYYIRANRIFRGNVQFCDAGFWIFVKPPQYSGRPDFSWEWCVFSLSCGHIPNFRPFNEKPKPRMIFRLGGSAQSCESKRSNLAFDQPPEELYAFCTRSLHANANKNIEKQQFPLFLLRLFSDPPNFFFLAGCAEPRCDDFKEWHSEFQGNTSFSVSKGRPGPQISESGEHGSFSGNSVSFSGNMLLLTETAFPLSVSFTGNPGSFN